MDLHYVWSYDIYMTNISLENPWKGDFKMPKKIFKDTTHFLSHPRTWQTWKFIKYGHVMCRRKPMEKGFWFILTDSCPTQNLVLGSKWPKMISSLKMCQITIFSDQWCLATPATLKNEVKTGAMSTLLFEYQVKVGLKIFFKSFTRFKSFKRFKSFFNFHILGEGINFWVVFELPK